MKILSKCLIAVSCVALGLVGCSQSEGSPDATVNESAEVPIFTGTLSEYTELMRTCFEEQGIETFGDDASGNGSFSVDASVDVAEIQEICDAQVGVPAVEDLSEDVLQERYEARVEQWECLVDEGLVTGDPITYETFVDDYNRSDPPQLWEPTFSYEPDDSAGPVSPSDLCPRDTF